MRDLADRLTDERGRPIDTASASARLRDLRKPRFGGYTLPKRRRTGGYGWECMIDLVKSGLAPAPAGGRQAVLGEGFAPPPHSAW